MEITSETRNDDKHGIIEVEEKTIEKTIGILSEEDAKVIKPYLEVGRTDLYECRVSRFDKDGDENKRFSIAIFILAKDDAIQHKKGLKLIPNKMTMTLNLSKL